MRKLFYISNLFALGMVLSSGTAKAQAPVIGTDPHDSAVCAGTVAVFSTDATGSPTFSWQEFDGSVWTTLGDGGLYAGTTTANLSVYGSSAVNGRMYRAIANNSSGADTSAMAMITVNPLADAGVLTGHSHMCASSSDVIVSTMPVGSWSSSNTAVATISGTGNIYAVATGVTTISHIASNSCGADTATFTVTVDGPITYAPVTGPSTVCVGSTINLSNAYTGGAWSVSNANASVSASGVVSGVAAGSVTVKYVYSNACGSDSATAVVTVETPLSAGTVTGVDTICSGTLATFTSTGAGGVWLSSNNDVATVDLMSGMATGRGQGTAVISYMASNSCGGSVATHDLVVERTASMIVGSDSVGVGMTEVLMDSVAGGMWMSADVTIASVNASTGSVHGNAEGSTVITYEVDNACGVTSANITIYVGVAGSAGFLTGSDSVCAGSAITLTPSVAGGVWTSTNASASVDALGVVTGLIGGMKDTIIYTVTDGFGSSSVRKVIYINQPPIDTVSGPTDIALGIAYALHTTYPGGVWTSSNPAAVTFISGNVFVVTQRGVTNLYYTVSNACGTTVDTFVVNLPVFNGVANVTSGSSFLSVVPNPNNGSFVMNVAGAANEVANVTITNVTGAVVKEMNINTNSNTRLELDQPSGVYIVTARTSNNTYTARFVVTK
jgi:hypothetical protein